MFFFLILHLIFYFTIKTVNVKDYPLFLLVRNLLCASRKVSQFLNEIGLKTIFLLAYYRNVLLVYMANLG